MREKFRKVDIILIFCVGATAFALSFNKIEDPDIWWHLKCGELFVEKGTILKQEIFSYTAQGTPWVDGYLLAQALFYICWKFFGAGGVIFLGSLLVTLGFVLAMLVAGRTKDGSLMSAIALSAVFLASPSMLPRPALFTPLFTLVFLYLLEGHRTNLSKKVFFLVPLTALWANIHPAFWLGFVFTFFYLVAELADKRKVKALLLLLCLEVFASLINPYFYRIYYSAYEMARNPYLKNTIMEWKPLFSEPTKFQGIIYCFIFLVLAWLFLVVRRRFRIKVTHALCFLFVTLITVYSRRNILLFALTAIPIIGWTATTEKKSLFIKKEGIRKIGRGFVKGGVVLTSLFLIGSSATNRLSLWTNSFSERGIGINENMFPSEITDFLLKEKVQGRIFHPYELGGFLIFELFPHYEVYFDGRVFPYLPEIYELGENARADFNTFLKLHSRYGFGAVLVPIYPQSYWELLNNLLDSPERWAQVKANDWGVLFLERGRGNDDIIARHEISLFTQTPKLHRLTPTKFLFWEKAVYPFGQIMWAKFYESRGLYERSVQALKPAVEMPYSDGDLKVWLGSLLIQGGKPDDGFIYIEKALEKSPTSPPALSALADYYLAKHNYVEAERVLLMLVREKPRSAKVWNTLGELAFNRMDYQEAATRFERALELEPANELYKQRLVQALYKFDPLRAQQLLKEGFIQ